MSTSRRELGKAKRRQRIVEAAIALTREYGYDAVSMVQIAERAQLSPATLYNLFQTKDAIFRRVFDLDIQKYERLVDAAHVPKALERIFAAIEIAATLFEGDPRLYRSYLRAVVGDGSEHLGPIIAQPRLTFWQRLLAAAVADRQLKISTDANLLGRTLGQIMGGVLMHWAANLITAERLAAEASYAVALILLPNATPDTAPLLRQRIRILQNNCLRAVPGSKPPHDLPQPEHMPSESSTRDATARKSKVGA